MSRNNLNDNDKLLITLKAVVVTSVLSFGGGFLTSSFLGNCNSAFNKKIDNLNNNPTPKKSEAALRLKS